MFRRAARVLLLLLCVLGPRRTVLAREVEALAPEADVDRATADGEIGARELEAGALERLPGLLEEREWAAADRADGFARAPLAAAHGVSLGLSAGLASSPGERQRVFGLVELRIGLDAWVGAHAAEADALDEPLGVALGVEPSGGAAGGFLPAGASRPAASLSPSAPSIAAEATLPAPRASAAARSRPPASEAGSGLALVKLARALVAEALRVRGDAAELRRLDGMASRSRAAASLPEVRLGAGTAQDESQRYSPTLADPARFTRDGGRDLWLEARLTWRLDSALFARDEVAIMRLRAQRQEESQRLAREVEDALIEWRRASLALASPLIPPEERDVASVRQFGAVARLDVLTDGWFSRYLERWAPDGGMTPWP